MLKQLLYSILSVLLGAVFIFSAYTKLYPVEPFELTFVDLGIASWRVAPFMARFLIGLEFFTGALLLFNLNIKFAGKLTIFLLSVFIVYLLALIAFTGNKGNCGCFGNYIVMTPLQGIIKNIILLLFTFLLLKNYDGPDYKKITKPLFYFLILFSFALPHILNYVDLNYSQAYLNSPEDHFKLELDSLYKDAKLNVPPKDLSKGKRIIAFMSLSCPHCRIAASKIRIMQERNPAIPIYFVLNGEDEKLAPFFEETKSNKIPHCMLLGRNFVFLAGTNMPSIYLVNNSVVESRIDYMSLDQTEIEKWLGLKN